MKIKKERRSRTKKNYDNRASCDYLIREIGKVKEALSLHPPRNITLVLLRRFDVLNNLLGDMKCDF